MRNHVVMGWPSYSVCSFRFSFIRFPSSFLNLIFSFLFSFQVYFTLFRKCLEIWNIVLNSEICSCLSNYVHTFKKRLLIWKLMFGISKIVHIFQWSLEIHKLFAIYQNYSACANCSHIFQENFHFFKAIVFGMNAVVLSLYNSCYKKSQVVTCLVFPIA